MLTDNATPQQILINNLTVRQLNANGQGTIIDQAFGNPGFSVRNLTLSIISQTNFQ